MRLEGNKFPKWYRVSYWARCIKAHRRRTTYRLEGLDDTGSCAKRLEGKRDKVARFSTCHLDDAQVMIRNGLARMNKRP